jgi:hypothetical protein
MKYKTETDPNSTKEKEANAFYCCSSRPFLLLATTSYFVATKGFDYVKIL